VGPVVINKPFLSIGTFSEKDETIPFLGDSHCILMLDYFTKLSGTVVADCTYVPKISEVLRQPLLLPTLLVTSFEASTSLFTQLLLLERSACVGLADRTSFA
jgi:hypothetical protein